MTTLQTETLLELVASRSPQPNVSEPTVNLRISLSVTDEVSYRVLEKTLYDSVLDVDSLEYNLSVVAAYNSPLHSDSAKGYFTAANMGNRLTLSLGDKFLTEKIILSYLDGSESNPLDFDYFATLMQSKHLSGSIILAGIRKSSVDTTLFSVDLIPDIMITPEVVTSWIARTTIGMGECVSGHIEEIAAFRVKKAYPELERISNELVLKTFTQK